MNLIVCVAIVGLVHGSNTPPPQNVEVSTAQPLPAENGSTTQITLPAVSGNTNKQPSIITALESEILGIVGTKNAVNLEVKAIGDIPRGDLPNTKESGNTVLAKAAENPDIVLTDQANTKVATTAKSDKMVPNATADGVSENKQNIDNKFNNLTETAEMPKEINISVKEKMGTDTSIAGAKEKTVNPAENSVSDKNVADAGMPSESMVNEGIVVNKVLVAGDISLDIGKADKTPNCNVKNRKCVPTREELVADGVENVDRMQHAIDFKPPELNLDKLSNSKTVDAKSNKNGEKKDCNEKNSTCVPTREELAAAGVENVDMMQHAIDLNPPAFDSNTPSISKPTETNLNKPSTGCNVKNSTCVPTREELVAAGVENVDSMQHAVDFKPPEFNSNKPSSTKPAEIISDKPSSGCNVKNSTCVPSEKELIASGNDMNIPIQFSIDTENSFLGQFKQSDSDLVNTEKAKPLNNVDSTGTDASMTSRSENKDKKIGNVPSLKTSADEITKVVKPATVQQIPEPSQTTQPTKSAGLTTASNTSQISTTVSSNLMSPNKSGKELPNETTQRLTTPAVKTRMTSAAEQTKVVRTELKTCPQIKCQETCSYGRKVNSDGCETCECKFSNNCPQVTLASRLLCLLRASTSQSCTSNTDCRRNRICCPGACAPTCRRASSSNSMFLSMLVD